MDWAAVSAAVHLKGSQQPFLQSPHVCLLLGVHCGLKPVLGLGHFGLTVPARRYSGLVLGRYYPQ
jgi:hypothetical protein